MIQRNGNSWWSNFPPVTKNIILINIAVLVVEWLGTTFTGNSNWLLQYFGLWNWGTSAFHGANSFHLWQPFTYMFMHSGFWHLFCNMFAVMMFGPSIEQRWGTRKYTIYYIVCGVGAALVQELVWMITNGAYPAVTVGASGAVFGVLLAFGWLFPEVKMFLLFIPIPIPSRIFVGLYAIFELFEGIANMSGDNVAHFAHLGGMIFGILLILYWKHTGQDGFEYRQYHSSWWQKVKSRFASLFHGKTDRTSKDFSGYHYQAPVGASQEKTAEEKQREEDRNAEVNRLLEKIKREGYEALTQEEKDLLFKH